MPKPKKPLPSYARLNLKFKSNKAAYRAYRFLSMGYELDLLPKLELALDGSALIVGWYGTSFEIKL